MKKAISTIAVLAISFSSASLFANVTGGSSADHSLPPCLPGSDTDRPASISTMPALAPSFLDASEYLIDNSPVLLESGLDSKDGEPRESR